MAVCKFFDRFWLICALFVTMFVTLYRFSVCFFYCFRQLKFFLFGRTRLIFEIAVWRPNIFVMRRLLFDWHFSYFDVNCYSGLAVCQLCHVVLSPVYTIQPVVKPVVNPVWQPVVSCIQPVVKPVVQPGLTTGWTNSGCSFNTVIKPVVQPVWHPVVSCKRGITAKRCQCSRKHIFYHLMNSDDDLLVESHLCATERIIRVYSTRSSIYFYVFKEVRGRVHCVQSPACCTKRNS